MKGRQPLDLIGQRYGLLTVIAKSERTDSRRNSYWVCICECGNELTASAPNLRQRPDVSCGDCANKRRAVAKTTHGHSSKRQNSTPNGQSPTYATWASMKQRCMNPKNRKYPQYGGRGIRICERWVQDFETFLSDMGERPDGTTIDRIDVDGHYEPGNCRWATPVAQNRNRRDNVLEEHEPEQIRWLAALGYQLTEIARFFQVTYWTVHDVVTGRSWRQSSLPPRALSYLDQFLAVHE